ncbi:MAG: iron ABC transporter permease [Spirochaetales bacterium]|nr:iron ABC transporter permease [Spirochaetales bacterium]
MNARRIPAGLLVPALALALLAAMLGSVFWGRSLSFSDVTAFILTRIPALAAALSVTPPARVALNVLDLALPRILTAAITGAGLAWSGALFQALFRNPLADPYFLGVSAGASFGSTLVVVLAGPAAAALAGLSLSSLSAFASALAAVTAVYFIARQRGRLPVVNLVLAGVAVSAVLTALVSALMLFGGERFERIIFATMGSFARATWEKAALAWPILLLAMAASFLFSRDLNLILLGEERAFGLGVEVERRKRLLLGLATLIGAATVAVSGIIWFAGLIVPHLARLLAGPDNRRLLPVSALAGAILLTVADALSRTIVPPYDVPIGIFTALLGAPFFIYLLVRSKKAGSSGRSV